VLSLKHALRVTSAPPTELTSTPSVEMELTVATVLPLKHLAQMVILVQVKLSILTKKLVAFLAAQDNTLTQNQRLASLVKQDTSALKVLPLQDLTPSQNVVKFVNLVSTV
jgi:hypothetical protein